MSKNQISEHQTRGGIQFSLLGLIGFSVSLVVAGGLLTSGLLTAHFKALNCRPGSGPTPIEADSTSQAALREMPAWGELITREIEVERPEEYAAAEVSTDHVPAWTFEGMSRDQVSALMQGSGLSPAQVSRALSPELVTVTPTHTVIKPDDDLVFSLAPNTRAKLYGELARYPANHYMQFPFCFPEQSLDERFGSSNLDGTVIDRIKRLLYPRGEARCFSDFEVVMRGLPSDRERLWLIKVLSRQRALLVKLRIRPDMDIDKVLGYWSRGLQVKDARPLLESVKRLAGGGSISLMYLLPHFVRERLYTFPMPPKPNDPAMDCHWSTMNFFNENPDDRFGDPSYTVQYLKTHFYPVAKPTLYGDIVLVLNEEGNAVHSAVYLADDIVFTKNGNNYTQPWMLMRMKDLLANYSTFLPLKLAVYRNKDW